MTNDTAAPKTQQASEDWSVGESILRNADCLIDVTRREPEEILGALIRQGDREVYERILKEE